MFIDMVIFIVGICKIVANTNFKHIKEKTTFCVLFFAIDNFSYKLDRKIEFIAIDVIFRGKKLIPFLN